MSDKIVRKEWLKAEVVDLINSYQGKPELWDASCRIYRDKKKKHGALREMAEKFSTTVEEIQRKIHNLRNQFNTELKKTKTTKTGQGTDELYVSKWPYYNLLLFLQKGLTSRPVIANSPVNTTVMGVANENETPYGNQDTCGRLEDFNFSNSPSISQTKEANPKKKRKIEVSKNDLLMEIAMRTLNDEEDEYEIFGRYVASEMRNLSSDYLRKKMKRKFQQIILEISEEDELISSASSQSYVR